MGLVLDASKLEKALAEIHKNPKEPNHVGALIELIRPIISLTRDRFPQHLGEDLEQEIRLFFIKRADYIAKIYFEGKIKNPTNYFFTVCRNSAINHMKREIKNDNRLIPLDDVQVEPVYKGNNAAARQDVVKEIREEILKFCKDLYPKNPKMIKRAQKFAMAMMEGKRPSFRNEKLKSFAECDQQAAKDVYSIVEEELKRLIRINLEDLLA